MEFTVSAATRHLNTPLRELRLRKGILLAVIMREGEIIIPEFLLHPGGGLGHYHRPGVPPAGPQRHLCR